MASVRVGADTSHLVCVAVEYYDFVTIHSDAERESPATDSDPGQSRAYRVPSIRRCSAADKARKATNARSFLQSADGRQDPADRGMKAIGISGSIEAPYERKNTSSAGRSPPIL